MGRRQAVIPPDYDPSTPLPSQQWERFAQFVAVGVGIDEAYARAGYAPSRANSWRLYSNPFVKARIRAIVKAGADAAAATVERTVQEIAALAYANLDDYAEWGPDGVVIKHSDLLTRAQKAGLVEVEKTKTGVKVKLDKSGALDKLMRYLGAYAAEKHEHSGPNGAPIAIQKIERVIVDPHDSDAASLPPAPPAGAV